ncbi:SMI1/KNR4 family protein [Deinococcus lacus]|uniref:SMI1/KNR4 family protein n=1 Tax=Deinococcus lacus TaxID=392561 RepID=A0ABW1YH81_9DEIO
MPWPFLPALTLGALLGASSPAPAAQAPALAAAPQEVSMPANVAPHPAPLPADAPLPEVLARLDAWYAQYAPAIHATLRPGASDAELDALEARLSQALPPDFRALYRWHDGQNWRVGGFFGLDWLPLAEVEGRWGTWDDIARENSDMNVMMPTVSHPTGAIREQYASAVWVPFLHGGGGNHVSVDLGPDVAGVRGQVITTGRDEIHRYVLAGSVDAFLREYLRRLETGRVQVQALDGYEQEMWDVTLTDAAGVAHDGYFQLGNLFPGFGAAPATPEQNPQDEGWRLNEALTRLDAFLAAQHPDLLASLAPGATPAELNSAEARLGRPLPPEVRAWYAQHRDWGELFGLRSISLSELGRADLPGFGTPDAAGVVVPFNAYAAPSSAADWLPLWEDGAGGYLGINLANHGEVRTFGAVQPRFILAEELGRVLDHYVRLAEAGLLVHSGRSLRVPDVHGQIGHSVNAAFPGFGVVPATLPVPPNISAP